MAPGAGRRRRRGAAPPGPGGAGRDATAPAVPRLAARGPTYATIGCAVVAILTVGLVVPGLVGRADPGGVGPGSVTVSALPAGPPLDSDPRPPPADAGLSLVTSPAPSPGTVLTAADQGVTPTTVTVGVVLAGLGAVAAFGIDVSQLDPKLQRSYWDSAAARVNAAGGVDGRRLVLTYVQADILSADSQRAACRTLTDDRHVFAVVNVLGFTGDPVLCVTRDHDTPFIGADGAAPAAYAASDRLITLEPPVELTVSLFVDRLASLGELRGRTVGVVHATGAAGVDGATLRRLLFRAGARAVLDAPLGDQDPLVVSGQVAAAERRFQQGGVDRVILLTNAVYGTVFATQADQGRFTPTFLLTDFGGATAGDSFIANMPASFFVRALAVTTTELGRGRAGLAESPLDAGCRQAYRDLVHRPVERDGADAVSAIASCAVVQVLTMGLSAAGANPTRSGFVAGLRRSGSFAVPGFGRGALGPAKPFVADEVALAVGHADCQCWYAVDGFRPLPAVPGGTPPVPAGHP